MLGSLSRLSASCCKSRAAVVSCTGQVKASKLKRGGDGGFSLLCAFQSTCNLQLSRGGGGGGSKGVASAACFRRLASMASVPSRHVEHVVLFKLKEDATAEKEGIFLASLRGLRDLDIALELTVEPVLSVGPSGFTHALYGRYQDKAALKAYDVHPEHVRAVSMLKPMVDNILAVDWEAVADASGEGGEIGAIRIVLLKPKAALEEEKLAETVSKLKGVSPAHVSESSQGINFSARSQGYDAAFFLKFRSVQGLEEFSSDPKHVRLQEEDLKPLAEDMIVVDLSTASAKGGARL